MSTKILVFGMDGNVIDNYQIKSVCAGEAMMVIAIRYFGIDREVDYWAAIYIQTSGKNSLEQFRVAYKTVTHERNITQNILELTERLYRQKLEEEEKNIFVFDDVRVFINELDEKRFHSVITTTVPIKNISTLVEKNKMDSLFEIICARDGAWKNGDTVLIEGFDKGSEHFDYLKTYFEVKKEDMIAFSSTTQDIINALEYGITSIAVEHIHKQRTLNKLNPSYVIPDFYSANKVLNELLNH